MCGPARGHGHVSGCFITLEGVEGCGKSTQLARLSTYLRARGQAVLVTREPGGTPTAEAVREVLLNPAHDAMSAQAELLLYAAARADHVQQVVLPALNAGKVVLCDRYVDSTVAYQGYARGLGTEPIENIHALSAGGLMPHRTYLFDLPEEEGLRRARERGRFDRLEQESIDFHKRVRQGFLTLARHAPARITIYDGRMAIDELAALVAHDTDLLLSRLSREGQEAKEPPTDGT